MKNNVRKIVVADGSSNLERLLPQRRDKMQSETSYFAHCAANWRTRRNIFVVFGWGRFAPLCENMTSFTKPEVYVTYCIAVRRRSSHCNKQRVKQNLVIFDIVVFEISERIDKQKNRHTDTLIAIFCTLTGGEVIVQARYCYRPGSTLL